MKHVKFIILSFKENFKKIRDITKVSIIIMPVLHKYISCISVIEAEFLTLKINQTFDRKKCFPCFLTGKKN